MQYMIIMGVLIAIALVLFIIIIVTLVKNKKNQDDYDYDDYDDNYDDDYDEEYEEEYEQPRRAGQAPSGREAEQTEPIPVKVRDGAPSNPGPVKRQWKVILENLDTWERFSFIFYDNIGIGRGRTNQEFEKYLSVQEDPRISKLHCAIIRKGDQLYLKDMGSRNGTYLNGKRIQQPVMIQRDDIIGIGETKIEVKKVLREKEQF